MNRSPWTDIDDAFQPMYNENIVIQGKRNGQEFKQTIECSIFTSITGEPLSDEAVQTDREDITLTIQRKDYAFVKKLLPGDVIRRPEYNGMHYKIVEVKNDEVMGLVIAARSVKRITRQTWQAD